MNGANVRNQRRSRVSAALLVAVACAPGVAVGADAAAGVERAPAREAVAELERVLRGIGVPLEQLPQVAALHRLLAAELAGVKRTCGDLSPRARTEVRAESRRSLDAVIVTVLQLQGRPRSGGAGENAPAAPFDVRRAVHELVAAALRPHAAPDEFAAFELEWQKRRERHAEATRLQIVSRLDSRLGLSAAQRRAVLDDLRANWQPGWLAALDDLRTNDGVPPAPDFAGTSIVPHLGPDQERRWREWIRVAGMGSLPPVNLPLGVAIGQPAERKPDMWWEP